MYRIFVLTVKRGVCILDKYLIYEQTHLRATVC